MKKYTVQICVGLIFVLLLGVTAYALPINTTKEIVQTKQKDSVVYTVRASSSSVSGFSRQANSNITVNVEVSSEDKVELATRPIVATDEEMNNTIEIADISLEENSLNFELSFQKIPDMIYLQSPFVTRIKECNVIATAEDITDLSVENYFDESLGVNFLTLHFASDTFGAIPNKVELEHDEIIYQALFVNQYFDSQGECIGGEITFVVPESLSLIDLNLRITESIEVAEQEVIAIATKELLT